jgi:predicted metalloprotease with PDZ domain
MKSNPGLTLADATERMFRDGAFMRVYWEGAAIMLLADQRLRSRSGGVQSLDSALAQLRACCLSADTAWQAREVFAKLDELTRTQVFSELYDAHVASTAFPPVADAYRLLGLAVEEEGQSIRMVDAAPQIAFRDAIMRAPVP